MSANHVSSTSDNMASFPTSQQQQAEIETSKSIINEIANRTSPELVAQRHDITEGQLIRLLSDNPAMRDGLFDAMSLRMVIRAYSTFMMATDSIENNIDQMDAKDLAKFYATIAGVLGAFMGHKNNTIDVILNSMPPEARMAVLRLLNTA